jgi:predicted protein tyrosine phosphatase
VSRNVLFVCSQNKLRSPTAEQIFAEWPRIEVSSAGLNNDAEEPLTAELVEWADVIFVREQAHRNRLLKKFKHSLKARLIVLGIPDDYKFMEEALIRLLKAKVTPHLPV